MTSCVPTQRPYGAQQAGPQLFLSTQFAQQRGHFFRDGTLKMPHNTRHTRTTAHVRVSPTQMASFTSLEKKFNLSQKSNFQPSTTKPGNKEASNC